MDSCTFANAFLSIILKKKKKKSVLKKNDHFSSFPALFLSQEHETFYSGSQIPFLSGGGRSQGNGPPLGIYTGWEI